MKHEDKVELVSKTTLIIGELLDKLSDELEPMDAFEITSNICLRLTTYPMNFIGDDVMDEYIENFTKKSAEMMEEFIDHLSETAH